MNEYRYTFNDVEPSKLSAVGERFERIAAASFGSFGSGTNSVPLFAAGTAHRYNVEAERLRDNASTAKHV